MSGSEDLGSPEARLEEAVKQISLARDDVRAPDQDAALSKAQYLTAGVLRELEESDDGVDPHLITDGGSKYVNPTGDGYCGVGQVSGDSVSFGLGMFPVEWDADATVYAVKESPGIALVEDEPDENLGRYTVSKGWRNSPGTTITVSGPSLELLGVSHGDDVRAYERDGGGLLLVSADDDPFVDGGDGA